MKLILSSALAFGLLGSAGFATIDGSASKNTAFLATSTHEVRAAPTRFRVWTAGRETACTVLRVAARPDGPAAVRLSPECGKVGLLSGVGQWRTKRDETVALADDDGRVRVEFARGDGVAYETFRPDAPLMAMVALD